MLDPNTDLEEVLERFEAHTGAMCPAYAERVRDHLRRRIRETYEDLLPEIEPEEAKEEPYVVIHEGTPDETIVLLTEAVRIGRASQCDLQIRGDSKISRTHCELRPTNRGWVVVDLDSANFTLVNGERLEPSTPRSLFGGEELIVGETFLRFRTTLR